MTLLTQTSYTIKRIPKENYRFDLSAETIVLPADASGIVSDYSGAKVDLKLSYDGKEIYPNHDEKLEEEIEGRNLISNLAQNWRQGTYVGGSLEDILYNTRIRVSSEIAVESEREYVVSIPSEYEVWIPEMNASKVGIARTSAVFWSSKVFKTGIETKYIKVSIRKKGVSYGSTNPDDFIFPADIDNIHIKLEKGNKPTDWFPAPEDLDSQITSSLITKNSDATVTNGILSITNLTTDAGYVDVTVDYGVWKQTKRVTIAKSKQGDKGDDGKSITLVDVQYAVNTSPSTPPVETSNLWKTLADPFSGDEQLWTRTKTTYSSGNLTYTTPANITPKKGDTGSTGTGIESITEEYYLSTSKTTQTGGSWVTVPPTWGYGKYIWTRSKIVYKNPTSTAYTTAIVSSEWEAVDSIKVGGKNLLREQDIRFDFKYWGGDGESINVDFDNLKSILTTENNLMLITENNFLIEM